MKQQTVEIKFCRKMEVIHRRHESCVSLRTDKHVECLIKLVLATLACDRLFYWCIMSFYATLARPGTDSEVFIIDLLIKEMFDFDPTDDVFLVRVKT